MSKVKKIVVRLAYSSHLLLDVTQENMKLALQLLEQDIYDDRWEENDKVWYPKQSEEISVRIENVTVRPEPQD